MADDLCGKWIYRNENWTIEQGRKVCGTDRKILVSIMSMDIDDPVKQCYEMQASNINVRNWAKDLKDLLHSIRLAFV